MENQAKMSYISTITFKNNNYAWPFCIMLAILTKHYQFFWKISARQVIQTGDWLLKKILKFWGMQMWFSTGRAMCCSFWPPKGWTVI